MYKQHSLKRTVYRRFDVKTPEVNPDYKTLAERSDSTRLVVV